MPGTIDGLKESQECVDCGIEKRIEEYRWESKNRGRRYSVCKVCDSIRRRKKNRILRGLCLGCDHLIYETEMREGRCERCYTDYVIRTRAKKWNTLPTTYEIEIPKRLIKQETHRVCRFCKVYQPILNFCRCKKNSPERKWKCKQCCNKERTIRKEKQRKGDDKTKRKFIDWQK